MHKPLFSLPCLSVCLFVCVSVSNITQNVMNGLWWKIMEGSLVVTGWFDFACPIGNLANSQQIMSGFWWHIYCSPALIYLSIDWIYEVIWITKLSLQLGYMGKMRILSCLSWGLRAWSALASECTLKPKNIIFNGTSACIQKTLLILLLLSKFALRSLISLLFVITWTCNSYHVVNYFHWPWLVTLGGIRNKCVK